MVPRRTIGKTIHHPILQLMCPIMSSYALDAGCCMPKPGTPWQRCTCGRHVRVESLIDGEATRHCIDPCCRWQFGGCCNGGCGVCLLGCLSGHLRKHEHPRHTVSLAPSHTRSVTSPTLNQRITTVAMHTTCTQFHLATSRCVPTPDACCFSSSCSDQQ